MAILKSIPRIAASNMPTAIALKHRAARERNPADRAAEIELAQIAAAFIANGGKVDALPTTGRPLECQKWYQRDYRSATPKGLVLKSAGVRGEFKRFAVS